MPTISYKFENLAALAAHLREKADTGRKTAEGLRSRTAADKERIEAAAYEEIAKLLDHTTLGA